MQFQFSSHMFLKYHKEQGVKICQSWAECSKKPGAVDLSFQGCSNLMSLLDQVELWSLTETIIFVIRRVMDLEGPPSLL